jgi:hypothetical protein
LLETMAGSFFWDASSRRPEEATAKSPLSPGLLWARAREIPSQKGSHAHQQESYQRHQRTNRQ